MPEDLKSQEEIIDSGATDYILEPEKEAVIEIPELNYSGLKNREIKKRKEALNIFQQAGPQVQGEFKDFDPELDRGAMPGMDQNELRAENQTAGDLWKAGTFRFLNELTIGTLEAATLMGDVGMHVDAIKGVEQDFSNSISERLRAYKEELNEKYGRVYTSKEDEGFSPLSGSFWATNAGNIATALTLMIPSMAATKVLGGVAKTSKLLRSSSRAFKAGAKGVASAVISRFTENAMEAAEAVSSVKASLTSPLGGYITNPETGVPFTEEEVNTIAGEAGVNTWRSNWAMIVPDIIQYGKMFKGIDYARKTAQSVGGKSLLSSIGKFAISDMGSEGLEEGYQYITSQEAQYGAKSKAGIQDGSTFYDRLSDYLVDDEFKTSVFMGAVGGGLFSGAGAINNYKDAKAQLKQRQTLEDLHKKHRAALTGNPEAFEQTDDLTIVRNAIDYSSMGNLDMMEADLIELQESPKEDLEAQGLNPDEYRDKVSRAIDLVRKTGKEFNRVRNSSIPAELHKVAVGSRMDRVVAENRIKELNKEYDTLYESDQESFTANEKKTGSQMTELKKLVRAKNTKKAEALAESIVEQSDKYKNKNEVYKALETSNDVLYDAIDGFIDAYKTNITESQKVEDQLKTEDGIEALKATIKKAATKVERRRKEQAKKKEKTEEVAGEEVTDKDSPATPEQKMYKDKESKAKEKFKEFETTEPDGKKVFTTSPKHLKRTFVVGETVKDSKGNMYRVAVPIKGKGKGKYTVFGFKAYKLDKNGKQVGKETVNITNEKLLDLAPESRMPSSEEWTVTVTKNMDISAKEKEEREEITVETDMANGIVSGINTEFVNFKKVGNNWEFPDPSEEAPEKRKIGEGEFEERYDIDYDLAASPLTPGEIQEVTLETDSQFGFTTILVKQGDKIITKLQRAGREEQFESLVKHIGENGGSIKGTIKEKRVSYTGNLGNMKNAKQSVTVLEKSPFLPEGKIFIGSVKRGEGMMHFRASDGSSLEIPWNTEKASEKRDSRKPTGEGNTYIALLNPNGEITQVMLKEAIMDEVEIAPGKTLTDVTFDKLQEEANRQSEELNRAVDLLVKKGYEVSKAVEEVSKSPEFRKILRKAAENITGSLIRQNTLPEKVKLSDGTEIERRKKDHFDLILSYEPEVKEIQGQKVYGRGNVIVKVLNSRDAEFPTEKTKYLANEVKDPIEVKKLMGQRFMKTSLDIIKSDEDGGKYVSRMIKEGWFSTDINPERPWVNPMIRIELDNDAKLATKGDAKIRKKSNNSVKSNIYKKRNSELYDSLNKEDKEFIDKIKNKVDDSRLQKEIAKKATNTAEGNNLLDKYRAEDALNNPNSTIYEKASARQSLDKGLPYNAAQVSDFTKSVKDTLSRSHEESMKYYNEELAHLKRNNRKSSASRASAETNEEFIKETIREANTAVGGILELIPLENERVSAIERGKALTAEEYVNKYLKGLTSAEDFIEYVKADAAQDKREGAPLRNKYNKAAKNIVRDLISDAFESGEWDTIVENESGEVSGTTTETNPNSPDEVLRRSGVSEENIKAMEPGAKSFLVKKQLAKEAKEAANNKPTEEIVNEISKTDKEKSSENTNIKNSDFHDFRNKVGEIVALHYLNKKTTFHEIKKIDYYEDHIKVELQNTRTDNVSNVTIKDNKVSDIKFSRGEINPSIKHYRFEFNFGYKTAAKKPTFGKPKISKPKVREAKKTSVSSEIGGSPAIDQQLFAELGNLLNDVKTAGENLSPQAKKKIQDEAEIKCKPKK
ncbi:hypothetical protein [Tenacibaculum sp.]|uniref:hypothetical protein n=1 Tax=Tenacibaculum sp. TaxID=1906242 RepID=UPI003D11BE0C